MTKRNAKKPHYNCPDGMTDLLCPLNQDYVKNSLDEIYLVPDTSIDPFSPIDICNWCKKNNTHTR